MLNANLTVMALQSRPSEPSEAAVSTAMVPRPRLVVPEIVYPVTQVEEPPPPPPVFAHSERGDATWFDAPRGTCAHKTIKKGTIVTVSRPATGAVVTCRVADRGPFGVGRVIDLSRDTFAVLAGAEKGVIQVRIQW